MLRVWHREPGFLTYHCARCEASGWASEALAGDARAPDPQTLNKLRREAAAREARERAARLALARRLWITAAPLRRSPGEAYLRQARGYHGTLPATLRFLPARDPHPPAMIAAFGLATEPEPGVLALADEAVRGVHLTRLKPDGSGKAEGQGSAKIMIGPSAGWPIVLAPPNDGLGLAVAEGVEDALSAHAATGLGAWAAGSAGRLPGLADKIPSFIEAVTIVADADAAGQNGAHALADALVARGIETLLQGASSS